MFKIKMFAATLLMVCMTIPANACNLMNQNSTYVSENWSVIEQESPSYIFPSFAQPITTPFMVSGPVAVVEKFPLSPLVRPNYGVVPIGSPPGGDVIIPKLPHVTVPEGSTLANVFIGILATVFFGGCAWVRRQTMKDL